MPSPRKSSVTMFNSASSGWRSAPPSRDCSGASAGGWSSSTRSASGCLGHPRARRPPRDQYMANFCSPERARFLAIKHLFPIARSTAHGAAHARFHQRGHHLRFGREDRRLHRRRDGGPRHALSPAPGRQPYYWHVLTGAYQTSWATMHTSTAFRASCTRCSLRRRRRPGGLLHRRMIPGDTWSACWRGCSTSEHLAKRIKQALDGKVREGR